MKTYKGKTGFLLYFSFAIYNIIPICIFIYDFKGSFDTSLEITLWIFWYLLNIIFLPIIIQNKVVLDNESFTFYYGFTKKKYKLSEVETITKVKSAVATTANDINRIKIVFKDYKELELALKDNDEFINDLKKLKEETKN